MCETRHAGGSEELRRARGAEARAVFRCGAASPSRRFEPCWLTGVLMLRGRHRNDKARARRVFCGQ